MPASTATDNASDCCQRDESGYSYRRDVFPLQWRIAVSWVSGYFIFYFLTPSVFANQGAEAAGQLGLSMTIFSTFTTVGYSWISAKLPMLSAHIARKERRELNALFDKQATLAITATTLFSLAFLTVVHLAAEIAPNLANRLLPESALWLLATATVANTAVFAMAIYMRAHNEEPMMVVSVVSAILICIAIGYASKVSLLASVAAYSAINLLVVLPWCMVMFFRYRARKA